MLAALSVLLAISPAHAAKVMLRLHEDDGQYSGFPDSYPVCKSKMDYMHYDGTPTTAKRNLFDTKIGWIEIGVYEVGLSFNGTEVVNRLRTYESNGMDVAGVSLYREDWLATDTPGGEYPVDWRILSTTEITAVRNAIATASPPLRCKDSLKIIQLLGSGSGAWGEGSAGNFPIMTEAEKEHLKLFDGLGVECHIGDHEPGERRSVITAMAAISRWATDNNMTTFVFMGGGAPTYENLPRTQLTYQYLWSEMYKQGVDYRSDDIVYFRQGAWPGGKHTPESAYNTLTHQQRWVINTLKPGPGAPVSSLFVSEVQDLSIRTNASAAIPFFVGVAEMEPDLLAVGATSSNQVLVPNSNLKPRGRGFERVLSVVPNPLQTGNTTITLTVNDGTASMSASFLLTVTTANDYTAAASGPINDPITWGVPLPTSGDTNIWHTGNKIIDMTLNATDTFNGGTFEVETGGQLAPGVPVANLALNNLILDGGMISMANNSGFDFDLAGNQLLLNSGTLRTGSGGTMTVTFENGTLAGNGTINVTSSGTGGADVEISDTIHTLGFTGNFNISSNGILNLPLIPVDNASFGLNLTGTGRYANDADVGLTSLVISGTTIPAGTYAYTDFTPAQQAFFVNTTGNITVLSNTPPTLNPLADQNINEDTAFTVAFTMGDAQTAANSLTVRGFSSDAALVPNANFIFIGNGTNRTVTITPAPDQNGTAAVTLAVSDGWFTTTRTFALTVNAVNDAPTLGGISNQTVIAGNTLEIPITIGDAETSANALTLSANSSNTVLVPNADLVLGGAGTVRNLTVFPAANQEGSTLITLELSDGVLATTRTFVLTVAQPDTVTATANGQINNSTTWGGVPVPVSGNTSNWRTGNKSISMATANETFHGRTFVVQSGGQFAPGLPAANLALNNLALDGGTIYMGNNIGLNIDLSGMFFHLYNGTLKTGGLNNGRDVRFKNGAIAGSGIIAITGTDAAGSDVEFQSTIDTKGFTGIFRVKDNGILNLPPIGSANASFGVVLSGTGRYTNDANVTLSSLRIAGTAIAPGTYAYSNFTIEQQSFLVNTTGNITVLSIAPNSAPAISGVASPVDLTPNTASAPIPFAVDDLETPAASLAVNATSSNPALVTDGNILLSGNAENRTVTVAPAANQLGSATITLNVGDGSLTAGSTFTVNVTGNASETWRFAHFGTTASIGSATGTANPDGDAWTNDLEYLYGTDPHAAERGNLFIDNPAAGNITLTFDALAATGPGYTGLTRSYDLETTTSLASPASWTVVPGYENLTGTDETLTITLPFTNGPHFYRLKVRLLP